MKSKFTEVKIVWARISGFPAWPARVCSEPEAETIEHLKPASKHKQCAVMFLGSAWEKGWCCESWMIPLNESSLEKIDWKKVKNDPSYREAIVEAFRILRGRGSEIPEDYLQKVECGQSIDWTREDVCTVCKGSEHSGDSLVCDKCNYNETHLHCLPEPITEAPEGEWYCQSCCKKLKLPINYMPPVSPRPTTVLKSTVNSSPLSDQKKNSSKKNKKSLHIGKVHATSNGTLSKFQSPAAVDLENYEYSFTLDGIKKSMKELREPSVDLESPVSILDQKNESKYTKIKKPNIQPMCFLCDMKVRKQPNPVDKQSQDVNAIDDLKSLITCDFPGCFREFHPTCVYEHMPFPLSETARTYFNYNMQNLVWICPSHACVICGKCQNPSQIAQSSCIDSQNCFEFLRRDYSVDNLQSCSTCTFSICNSCAVVTLGNNSSEFVNLLKNTTRRQSQNFSSKIDSLINDFTPYKDSKSSNTAELFVPLTSIDLNLNGFNPKHVANLLEICKSGEISGNKGIVGLVKTAATMIHADGIQSGITTASGRLSVMRQSLNSQSINTSFEDHHDCKVLCCLNCLNSDTKLQICKYLESILGNEILNNRLAIPFLRPLLPGVDNYNVAPPFIDLFGIMERIRNLEISSTVQFTENLNEIKKLVYKILILYYITFLDDDSEHEDDKSSSPSDPSNGKRNSTVVQEYELDISCITCSKYSLKSEERKKITMTKASLWAKNCSLYQAFETVTEHNLKEFGVKNFSVSDRKKRRISKHLNEDQEVEAVEGIVIESENQNSSITLDECARSVKNRMLYLWRKECLATREINKERYHCLPKSLVEWEKIISKGSAYVATSAFEMQQKSQTIKPFVNNILQMVTEADVANELLKLKTSRDEENLQNVSNYKYTAKSSIEEKLAELQRATLLVLEAQTSLKAEIESSQRERALHDPLVEISLDDINAVQHLQLHNENLKWRVRQLTTSLEASDVIIHELKEQNKQLFNELLRYGNKLS